MHFFRSFPRSRRAFLAAGGAALIGCASLGAMSLGVASAEQPSTPKPPDSLIFSEAGFVKFDSEQVKERQDKFVNTLAAKLGVTSDKLQQALKDTEKELGPVPLLFGPGPEVAGGQGFSISITSDLSTAATAIGISEDKLREELKGKSLTDVAKAHNVDPKAVASALKSARIAELDKATQSGKLPSEVSSQIKANLDNEMDMLMTVVRGENLGPGEPGIRTIHISTDKPRP